MRMCPYPRPLSGNKFYSIGKGTYFFNDPRIGIYSFSTYFLLNDKEQLLFIEKTRKSIQRNQKLSKVPNLISVIAFH